MAEVSDTADSRSPAPPPGWRPWTFGGLVEGLNAIGTLCIFAVMILINSDIFGRFVFSSPVPGVKEMVELSIVGIVFLQLPHTLRVGRITRSDAAFKQLLLRFPRVAHFMSALYNLTGVLLAGLIVYGSVPRFARAWSDNHYIGNQAACRVSRVRGRTIITLAIKEFSWRRCGRFA
jgi:TRAP-type C4-dicarboxylate transport system permease small subunit